MAVDQAKPINLTHRHRRQASSHIGSGFNLPTLCRAQMKPGFFMPGNQPAEYFFNNAH